MSKSHYVVKRVRVKGPPDTTTPVMVKYQKGLRTTVAQSPHLNDDPALKANFDKWSAVTDQLDTAHGLVVSLRSQLITALGAEGSLRAQYLLTGGLFTSTVRTVFVDDAAAVLSMGMQLGGQATPIVISAPLDLRVVPVKKQPGHHVVRWHAERGAGLYDLQRSPNPASEATYVTVYSDRFAKFADEGNPGDLVWYRVRAHGNGTSAWSPAIAYVIH